VSCDDAKRAPYALLARRAWPQTWHASRTQ